jgi:uncharacterized protein (DUF58 family)
MQLIRNLFFTTRFFYGMSVLIAGLVMSYPFPVFLPVAKTACVLYALITIIDMVLLFNQRVRMEVDREMATVLSLGDDNVVTITVKNDSGITLQSDIVDELPEQLQVRNFLLRVTLLPGKITEYTYIVRPLSRGEYHFGRLHVFVRSAIGLVNRHIRVEASVMVPVYPSIIQMKKYEIRSSARLANEHGVRKVRSIGHSYEFDNIKRYMRGDDYRSINWKATSRRAQLMVNQFQDEKSQQVYCIIDKSRVMHLPFHGLTLFDHAVNASLVISNIVLGKQDKAGLITFDAAPKSLVKAERSKTQLKKILETLYKEREEGVEANYESLYLAVNKFVSGRALLFLYTNFESIYALHRVLPQLKRLNNQHLLVVIFFENVEISEYVNTPVDTLEDIYTHAIAEDYKLTKIQLAQELRQHGIMSMLINPEQLTVSSINKYLELKSMGMI